MYVVVSLWFSLLLLLPEACSKAIPSFAGPFICHADYVTKCDYGGDAMLFNIRTSPYSPYKPFEKQLITGNMTYKFPCDDNVRLHLKLDVFQNNQWKANSLIFKFPRACSDFRDHIPECFAMFIGGNSTSRKKPCIIDKGVYLLNHLVEWRFPGFPVLPYGRYRLHVNIGKPDNQDAMCMIIVGNIRPRPS